jgi:two-component system response regulator AgrA
MIPLYICEDELAVCERVKSVAEDQIMIANFDMGPIMAFTHPQELLAAHDAALVPAIYLLDVDLNDSMDGFALAAELRRRDPRGYIIFLTGHAERSYETFRHRLEAMDYIIKGTNEELQVRLRDCLASIVERQQRERRENSRYYTLRLFDTIRHIPMSQILYFEAHGRQHKLVLHTDNELVEFFGSLQSVEEELGEGFFRCHRGFLVNRERIANIKMPEQLVTLDNGETCPLSRRAKKEI